MERAGIMDSVDISRRGGIFFQQVTACPGIELQSGRIHHDKRRIPFNRTIQWWTDPVDLESLIGIDVFVMMVME